MARRLGESSNNSQSDRSAIRQEDSRRDDRGDHQSKHREDHGQPLESTASAITIRQREDEPRQAKRLSNEFNRSRPEIVSQRSQHEEPQNTNAGQQTEQGKHKTNLQCDVRFCR